MSFTYTGDPANSDLDLIRFLLWDTDGTDVLMSDEEYTYMLTTWGNVYEAGRACAERIAAKFTRQADHITRTVGDLTISKSYTAKADEYTKLSDELAEQRARLFPATPVVARNNLLATSDRDFSSPRRTDFFEGMTDNRSF
jgi:hypothetical protein